MKKERFWSFLWAKSIHCCWRIWDLTTLTWKTRMARFLSIITAAISLQTTRTHPLKQSGWHRNLLIFPMPYQSNILMPFTSDATRRESISCRPWSWVQMVLPTAMVLTCLTSTLMTAIQTILLKLTWPPQEMVRLDLILTCTVVERFACHCWEHGEEVRWKIGIRKFRLCFKSLCRFNQSSCQKRCISTNRDLSMNKELSKVRRKTKPMRTSSGMETSNSPWSKTSKTRQKGSNISLRDISTSRRTRFWNKQKNGSSTQRSVKLHTMVLLVTTTITGRIHSRSQRLNTRQCLKRQSRNWKKSLINYLNHQTRT